jgi:hypothetical protein
MNPGIIKPDCFALRHLLCTTSSALRYVICFALRRRNAAHYYSMFGIAFGRKACCKLASLEHVRRLQSDGV